MHRYLLGLALVCASLPPSAHAAVISRDWKTPGDGLLTYDDVNQREWLDLTESRLSMYSGFSWEQRFASLLPELEPGKTFAGFAVATGPHLIALAESAGIHIGTSNFLLNGDPVRRLLDLVGSTRNGFPLEGRAALGLLNDVSSPTALLPNTRISGQLEYFPFAGSGGRAQLSVAPGYRDVAVSASIGVWLLRPAPEPADLPLCGIMLAAYLVRSQSASSRTHKTRVPALQHLGCNKFLQRRQHSGT